MARWSGVLIRTAKARVKILPSAQADEHSQGRNEQSIKEMRATFISSLPKAEQHENRAISNSI
jgi:hypothetical protein